MPYLFIFRCIALVAGLACVLANSIATYVVLRHPGTRVNRYAAALYASGAAALGFVTTLSRAVRIADSTPLFWPEILGIIPLVILFIAATALIRALGRTQKDDDE